MWYYKTQIQVFFIGFSILSMLEKYSGCFHLFRIFGFCFLVF